MPRPLQANSTGKITQTCVMGQDPADGILQVFATPVLIGEEGRACARTTVAAEERELRHWETAQAS